MKPLLGMTVVSENRQGCTAWCFLKDVGGGCGYVLLCRKYVLQGQIHEEGQRWLLQEVRQGMLEFWWVRMHFQKLSIQTFLYRVQGARSWPQGLPYPQTAKTQKSQKWLVKTSLSSDDLDKYDMNSDSCYDGNLLGVFINPIHLEDSYTNVDPLAAPWWITDMSARIWQFPDLHDLSVMNFSLLRQHPRKAWVLTCTDNVAKALCMWPFIWWWYCAIKAVQVRSPLVSVRSRPFRRSNVDV